MKDGLVMALILVLVAGIGGCGREEESKTPAPSAEPKPETPKPETQKPGVDQVKDLVCGMMVAKDTSLVATFEGKEYRFCGEECLKKFKANPRMYMTEQ